MWISKKIKKIITKLPDQPGVYFFTRGREILYIGKATSLRDRVKSYFSSTGVETSRGGRIVRMLSLATGIRYQPTDSVLEALLLESTLIKKHQPKYNARAKDDKSYWFVAITDEDFPRVLMIRGQNLKAKEAIEATYGPFPNASELRVALRLIRKILPYRDKCKPLIGKKCFNAQIGLCPAVCSGVITSAAYRRQISHLKLFLAGRIRPLIATLIREMKTAARQQDFEKSARLRDQIRALKHLQDVSLIKNSMARGDPCDPHRIEAYDIAHLGGGAAVGVMVVMENGEVKPSDHRKFKVKHGADDLANLEEVISRRLAHHEWPFPDLIAVDGGGNQLLVARRAVAASGRRIPVAAVIKDERHRPKSILGGRKLSSGQSRLILLANHEAHRSALAFHRRQRRKIV